MFYTVLPYPSSTVPLPLGLAQWEFLHPQRFIDTRLYNTFDTENFFLVDQTDFSNFCIVHNVCDAFSDGINILKKNPQLSYIQVVQVLMLHTYYVIGYDMYLLLGWLTLQVILYFVIVFVFKKFRAKSIWKQL